MASAEVALPPGRWARARRAAALLPFFFAFGMLPGKAHAQSTIKTPGVRTPYSFEAEPHLTVGAFSPPGPGDDPGFGVGFRGTLELAPDGFIRPVNDSVGVGFGGELMRYDRKDARGTCDHFESGPNGTRVCTEVSGSGTSANYFIFPLVMQWNFWLTRTWSVFGEPGLALFVHDEDVDLAPFVFYAGGRYQLSSTVALTLRVGHPTFSFGASFLL